jgi:hypothetical protein
MVQVIAAVMGLTVKADNELKGEGNSYDFGARMLDQRWENGLRLMQWRKNTLVL